MPDSLDINGKFDADVLLVSLFKINQNKAIGLTRISGKDTAKQYR